MTMGWGNEWLRDATSKGLDTGYSARVPVLLICLALLAIGIVADSAILIVVWGLASLGALIAVLRAFLARREIKRLERRD